MTESAARNTFRTFIQDITAFIGSRPLGPDLQEALNHRYLSAHHPSVRDGQALILYLLPQGAIEFTR